MFPGPPREVEATWLGGAAEQIRAAEPSARPIRLLRWNCLGKSEAERGPCVAAAEKLAQAIRELPRDDFYGYQPIVVKIDNDPTVRPQSGLESADLVVEELVEGVSGEACQALTERIEARLGTVCQRSSTAEAYATQALESRASLAQPLQSAG